MLSTRSTLWLSLAFLLAPWAAAGPTISGRVAVAEGEPAAAAVQLVPVLGSFAGGELRLAGQADPEPAATAAVAEDATFRVVAPEIGMWKVRADAPGHAPAEYLLEPLLGAVELPALELAPAADLDVEVRGGGRPLSARVTAYRAAPAAGRFLGRRLVDRAAGAWNLPVFVGRTGDDGRLSVPVAGRGPFVVRAVAPGYAAAEHEAGGAGAVRLELVPGRERVLRAVDGAGRPVAGALVFEADTWLPLAATGADGRARIAQAGTLRLELVASDGARGEIALAAVADASDEPLDDVLVTLAAPPRIAGRVIDLASRRPIAGALVWPASAAGDFARSAGDGTYELLAEGGSRQGIWAAAGGYVTGFERLRQGGGAGVRGPTLALAPAAAVSGRVVDGGGEPVAGVGIECHELEPGGPGPRFFRMSRRPESRTARSSRDGAFRLDGLPAGVAHELHFRRDGYADSRLDVEELEPLEHRDGLEVVLRRGRQAAGRVLDAEDSPVAGATVRLTERPPADADVGRRLVMRRFGETPDAVAEHLTNAEGRFEVSDLAAGRYDLEVEAEGFARAGVPGVEVPEDAGEVDLGTVVLTRGVAIEGRVVDGEGRPLAAAEIRFDRDTRRPADFLAMTLAGQPPRARSNARGDFRLAGLRAGERVHLLVTRAGFVDATVPAVEAPTREPVEVAMQTAARVSGRVVDEGGRPLAGAQVEVGLEGQRLPGRRAETAADGTFEITDVAPGRVAVSAAAAGYQGGRLAGLEVPAGGALAGVTLALAPGAVVEGTVFAPDGLPVVGALVRAVEPGASRGFSFGDAATTDGDGRYWLDGLAVGRRTVIAEHEVYQRVARDVEVEPGVNRLDLIYEGGVEVSGRVLGPQGEPVVAARVRLESDGFAMSWPETASQADGQFVFAGVLPGLYRVTASKEGLAQARTPDAVTVGQSPVTGLELRLAAGVTLVGEVRGLTVDELAELRIYAANGRDYRAGEVGFDGRYRVHHLGPGDWRVAAEVSGGGRQASGRVTVGDDDAEVALDLDFGAGYVLTGTVLVGGQPLAGAIVFLSNGSRTVTAPDGGFRFEGVAAGRYEVRVASLARSGVRYGRVIEITGDEDLLIELVTARVAGAVRDAFDRQPLAGVAVRLEAVAADEGFSSIGETDSRGIFVFGDVPEGTWKVVAQRSGYGPGETVVDVRGAAVEDLEIELTPTEGLFFEVALAVGGAPAQVFVALLRGGEVVVGGSVETTENGGVRVTEVPPGAFELLVGAPGTTTVALPVVSPGRSGRVVLPFGGTLRVTVPDLEREPAAARIALVAPSGQPYRQVGWGGRVVSEPTLRGGRANVTGLESGLWTLTVTADDGRSWQQQVRVVAAATTDVTLD